MLSPLRLRSLLRGNIKRPFPIWKIVLSATPYVAGQSFTAADIMVAYDLHLANGTSFPAMELGAPIKRYPHILSYLERAEGRSAYQLMRKLCA